MLAQKKYFPEDISDAVLFFFMADSSALTEEYHVYLMQTAWQSLFKSQATALKILILPAPTDQPPELSTLIDFWAQSSKVLQSSSKQ